MRSPYYKGFKYCSRCGVLKKTEALRCDFCGAVLRTRGRNNSLAKRSMHRYVEVEL